MALTVGLVTVLLSGEKASTFVDPGSMSTMHAEINECSACHVASEHLISAWLEPLLGDGYGENNNGKCLTCHELGNENHSPHNLGSRHLSYLKSNAARPRNPTSTLSVVNARFWAQNTEPQDLECAICHNEHQGPGYDISNLSNQQCASCHTYSFDNFHSSHPQFTHYPYSRRTRIQFNHISHLGKHFLEQEYSGVAPERCQTCHVLGENGQYMQTNSYEMICSDCHSAQISGKARASSKGIAMFNVPGVDIETLEGSGLDIGEWPEYADETLTPFMELLLGINEEFHATAEIIDGLDLLDLGDASDQQLLQVQRFAWAVKTLIHDITLGGTLYLQKSLRSALGSDFEDEEQNALVGNLSPATMKDVQEEWFPNLVEEIIAHRRGERPFKRTTVLSPEAEVDTFNSARQGSSAIAVGKDEEIIFDEDEEIAFDEDEEIIFDEDEEIIFDEDEEIAFDEDEEIAFDEGEEIAFDEDEEIAFDEDEEIAFDEDEEISSSTNIGRVAVASADVTQLLDGEEWVAAGGWYRDGYVLRYRPTRHGDGLLKSWLDFSAETSTRPAGKVFDELSKQDAPGVCGKCHSVEQHESSQLFMNWTAAKPKKNTKSFTKFSHVAHFSLLGESGCQTCHQLSEDNDYDASFEHTDPQTFASNFDELKVEVCAECHNPSKAGEQCLSCHNYHIGDIQPTLTPTKAVFKRED